MMTSAPRSARISAASGPATNAEKSTTRRPARRPAGVEAGDALCELERGDGPFGTMGREGLLSGSTVIGEPVTTSS